MEGQQEGCILLPEHTQNPLKEPYGQGNDRKATSPLFDHFLTVPTMSLLGTWNPDHSKRMGGEVHCKQH